LSNEDKDGSLDADVRTFWCKDFRFFKIYGVSAQTRGEPIRTGGEGSIFRDFV